MFGMLGYIKKGEFDFLNGLFEARNGVFNRLSSGVCEYITSYGRAIQYGYTTVFSIINRDKIELKTNGFYTVTTKKWINNGLNEIGANIFQKDYVWYIRQNNNSVIEYRDGIYKIDSQNLLSYI